MSPTITSAFDETRLSEAWKTVQAVNATHSTVADASTQERKKANATRVNKFLSAASLVTLCKGWRPLKLVCVRVNEWRCVRERACVQLCVHARVCVHAHSACTCLRVCVCTCLHVSVWRDSLRYLRQRQLCERKRCEDLMKSSRVFDGVGGGDGEASSGDRKRRKLTLISHVVADGEEAVAKLERDLGKRRR